MDNPTFRGMRWNLLKSFDEIYTIDLHGNAKKKEIAPDGSKDENVFDIMQGVSVNVFIKTGKKASKALGSVFHNDVYGARKLKYDFLSNNSLNSIEFKKIECSAPDYYFVPKDFSNSEDYVVGFSINELFPNSVTGIVTMGDSFIIANSKNELVERLENFKNKEIIQAELTNKFGLGKNYAEWVLNNKPQIVLDDKKYIQIAYRPFDTKWTYFDNKLLWRWRYETMRHMVGEEGNISLVFSRQSTEGYWSAIQVTKSIADNRYHFSYKGIPQQAPLYTTPDNDDLLNETTRTPNLNISIVSEVAQGLGLTFTPEKTDAANSFAPVDLLDYIYAVLHSPSYRETYKEFLKIDFPRVPYPNDTTQFWQLVALGGELRQLHLLEGAVINQLITSYPESGSNLVDKPRYDDGKVYINDTQYFDGVPQLAWEFYIGRYQPAQKWLKDRKGRILAYEDILHYQRIIKAMVETDRLMQAIDQLGAL